MKILPLFFFILIFGCASSNYPPLEVVKYVDLDRYLGKWFEIARLPNSFQKNCLCSIAEYSIIDAETIRVINRCRKGAPDWEMDQADGKAFVVPNTNNAKLKVQFFWPFKGDYWIIELDEKDYSYVVVGEPSRKYLWILARTSSLDENIYKMLVEKAREKGFSVEKLIKSTEDCNKTK